MFLSLGNGCMGVQMFVIMLLFVSVDNINTNGEKEKIAQSRHGTGGLSDVDND